VSGVSGKAASPFIDAEADVSRPITRAEAPAIGPIGRKFIGIEKDSVYYAIARERLVAEISQSKFDFNAPVIKATQDKMEL